MAILLDTGFFLGLYHPNDSYHEKSLKIFQEISSGKFGLIYTSPYVISETSTLLLIRTKSNISLLQDFYQDLYGSSKFVQILPWTSVIEHKIWKQFFLINKTFQEKKQILSFTDISNIIYCQEYQIGNIATFDEHFAGFVSIVF